MVITKVADLLEALQELAHDGYNIHGIELFTQCGNCSSDIILESPVLNIIKNEDNHSVRLYFKNEEA